MGGGGGEGREGKGREMGGVLKIGDCIGQKQKITQQGVINNQKN